MKTSKTTDKSVKLICFYLCICFVIPSSLARQLSMCIVDMTHTFDESTLYWPDMARYKLNVVQNGTTDGGYWLQYEEYSSGVHVGTHMDAPAHVSLGGTTVDKIPLSSFIAEAAVVDITTRAESNPDTEVTTEDLLAWELATGQTLNGKILLIRSGWGHKWNNSDAFFGYTQNNKNEKHFPGVAVDTANWVVNNRRILCLGTETMSLDGGITSNNPTHQVILGHEIYGLENVANMDHLPVSGATLYVLPMKMGGASGAPVRIIAIFSSHLTQGPCTRFDQH